MWRCFINVIEVYNQLTLSYLYNLSGLDSVSFKGLKSKTETSSKTWKNRTSFWWIWPSQSLVEEGRRGDCRGDEGGDNWVEERTMFWLSGGKWGSFLSILPHLGEERLSHGVLERDLFRQSHCWIFKVLFFRNTNLPNRLTFKTLNRACGPRNSSFSWNLLFLQGHH